MGLSTSMYTGISGLNAHGEKMSTIGNNLANVNTTGFKKARMDFEDALYAPVATSAGPGQSASAAGSQDQVGRGVMVSAVIEDFSQGSMQSTNAATDLAIVGDGFFMVSPQGEESTFYTRAGNFRFDNDGNLVDPHGYVLQGWRVADSDPAAAGGNVAATSQEIRTVGDITDIQVETLQSEPEATGEVNIVANLDSSSLNRSTSAGNADPLFAMLESWDYTTNPDTPLGDNQYSYQSTIQVYDENGTGHNLTVYYDPVDETNLSNTTAGDSYWEYMVTVDPTEDNRTFWGTAANETKRGVLMAGSMTFDSAGEMQELSAYTLDDISGAGDSADLANWSQATISQNGYPLCVPNFSGTASADLATQADARPIEINLGAHSTTNSFNGAGNTADDVGGDVSTGLVNLDGFEAEDMVTTNYSAASGTLNQSQDGYAAGFLQDINVGQDGVVSGRYSNGEVLNLFVVGLSDFSSKQGLERVGGNLFSETRASGSAAPGRPGSGGLGVISSNSLEQSNVDISEEFVKMIITQKGFQANSRTITTTDQMLQEVVNLKR